MKLSKHRRTSKPSLKRSNARHRQLSYKNQLIGDFISDVKAQYHSDVASEQVIKGRILTPDEKKSIFSSARSFVRYNDDKYGIVR